MPRTAGQPLPAAFYEVQTMAHSTDNSSKDLPSSNGTTKSATAPIPPVRPVPPPDDPLPNPEPAAPSLDQPDPGVFHHNPVKPMRP
jgi:hypothetical protein